MNMRRGQRGITLASMALVLALAGFFIYVGMKLVPLYTEFSSVKESMEAVAGTPNVANMGKTKIIDLLQRRFDISYVDSVTKENVSIDDKTKVLKIAYEVRKPLMYNLDIVAKFEHSVKLGGG